VYDDLGKSDKSRPALGGSKALPYPRRLDIKAPGKDNLPYGEQRAGAACNRPILKGADSNTLFARSCGWCMYRD
jgi:hypothetical protein